MGLQPVMFGVIGVFLGGIGSIRGAALGGFVLGFLLVFSGLFLSQNLGVILVFAVLLVVVVFRPEGLLRSPSGA
jgi:branched-chain amino acid transport system permease protein